MTQAPLSEELKAETLKAYEECGRNKAQAARMLGIPSNTFRSRYEAATRGKIVGNLDGLVPDGQKLKGISTLYNSEGTPVMEWVKTNENLDRTLEIIRESALALVKEVTPAKPVKSPPKIQADLLNLYVLTDYHLGMMAKAGESGTEWNTDKAADFVLRWFDEAIKSSPDAEEAIFCQLGDFLHYDSLDAVTPTSRHLMDTDTRYSSLVSTAVFVLKEIVNRLLKKHKKLHILMAEGNHDIASSVWLRLLFSEFYRNEPRVTVEKNESPYYCYQFGKTGLFFHHGHKQKVQGVSKVFASIFRKEYGSSDYCYAHMGDKHHSESKEDGLMEVIQHPTLAPKDAYATRHGYVANRSASVITYSREYGKVKCVTIRPEMVR